MDSHARYYLSEMFQKKQIFKLNILKKLLSDENGCVSLVPSTRLLALPPFFLNDMKSGILYLLNCMLKKYDRSLGGIVIGYQNIKVLMDENTGIIPMGTPEIEVNISVEFYIFQPKIGSFLEGIINKKSNNHIGCLVHQYFNATILKPEDVDFDDWICKDFNVDDKIIFKVKDLDFTSLLPYIEGLVDENFSHKSSSKSSDYNDISDVNNKDVHDGSLTEELLSKIKDENSDGKLLENTKMKNRVEAEFKTLDVKINRIIRQTNSQIDAKKEDKKKKENGNEKQKGQHSSKGELTANCGDVGVKENQSFDEKIKKKKKEKEKEKEKEKGVDAFESFNSADQVIRENDEGLDFRRDCFSLEEYVHLENENSIDFVTPVKLKNEKKKKKKTKENESLNKTSECLPSKGEDSVFCSTRLEPKSKSKMMISFCSPVPHGLSSGTVDGKSLMWISDLSVLQSNGSGIVGMEKEQKKRHRRRRKEEEDEVESVPKKKKISSISFSETEDSSTKMSEIDKLMEKLCRERINRTKGDLNESEKVNFKGKKSAKKVLKQQGKEALNEDSVACGGKADGGEEISDEHSTINELYGQDLSGKKEFSAFGKDSIEKKSKDDTWEKSLKVKKNSKVQPSEVGSGEEEKKAAEELIDKDYIKGGKKPKTAGNKSEASREGTDDSLYNKPLKESKNIVDLRTYKPPTSRPTEELEKMTDRKDGELSDLSTGSSKRKHSRKKSKHKKKVKDCLQARDKFKNGSMYDVTYSPKKFHPDKSLFTDSEQSHTSPAKKRKEVNGVEAVSEKKPQVQNKLNIFCNDETIRMKSEPDRKVSKDSTKNEEVAKKSKRKPQSSDKQKESLYEKLLEQAKRLIDIKGESPYEKKRKSRSGSKKQSTIPEYLKPLD